MTKKQRKDEKNRDQAQDHDAHDAAQEQTPEQPAQLSDLERLEHERDELQQRLLRVSADYQNYVRRSQADVTTAKQQQLIGLARELVTVLDHFDHALQLNPQKTTAEQLMQGVVIVRDELMRTLTRFGVQRIDAEVGEPFDPNRHEAMLRQASENVESNHVAMQLQPGYAIDDKTIRPAKVAVAE